MALLDFINATGAGGLLDLDDPNQAALIDPLDFTGTQAGIANDAANAAQQQGLQAALAEIARQFDITQGNLNPFIQSGQGQLSFLEQGATPEGLDQLISQIMGGDTFQSLIGERTRGVQGQLASSGLRRSGEGISQAADIGSDLALQIEQLLFGRASGIAGRGLNAATGLGGFGQTFGQDQASILGLSGSVNANTILGNQQARQQGIQNLTSIFTNLFGGG